MDEKQEKLKNLVIAMLERGMTEEEIKTRVKTAGLELNEDTWQNAVKQFNAKQLQPQQTIQKQEIVSVYIDNSFSMDAESKYGKLVEVAKNKALDIVNAYKPNTKFLLITNDFEIKHQNRLTISRGEYFRLPRLDCFFKHFAKFRMLLDNPFHERARIVDTELDFLMSHKCCEQWKIRMFIGILEYLIKVASWLVVVYIEGKSHHSTPASFLTTSIAAELGNCLPITLIPM